MWVTGEYLSQIDSTLRVKLTQHWESDWTVRVKLTQHWESSWLKIESQIDSTLREGLNIESQIGSTLRVKLTQYWESIIDSTLRAKFYKVHFRASILARLSYQKSLKKLDWRVISKKNLLARLTGASMRAICCVMSSTFHLKALITDK